MTIKFNTTLVQYNDYDVENNSTYASNRMFFGRDEDSTYGQPIIGFANYTLIHNSTVRLGGRVYPAMEVLLTPWIEEGNECADQLDFVWELIDYSSNELKIQIHFDKPECVSADTNDGDILEINF